jgi:O-antigen/teichoic acid export membrane protein
MLQLQSRTTRSAPERADYARLFARNVMFGFGSQLVRLAIGVFLVGYQIRKLGVDQWGIVVWANGVVGLLALVQMGASSGFAKRLTTSLARGDRSRFTRCFSAAMTIAVMLAVATMGCAVVLAEVGTRWLPTQFPRGGQAHAVLLILGAAGAVGVLTLPFVGCLRAMHRLDVDARWNMVATILRCVLTVAFFEFVAATAVVYAAIVLLVRFMILVALGHWSRSHLPEARWRLDLVSSRSLISQFGFNLLAMFHPLNYALFVHGPSVVLGSVCGLALVGVYGIGLQLNLLLMAFAQVLQKSVAPVITSLAATSDVVQSRNLFLLTAKCFMTAGIVVLVICCFWGQALMQLWVGDLANDIAAALPWAVWTFVVGMFGMAAAEVLVAHERLKMSAASGLLIASLVLAGLICVPDASVRDQALWAFRLIACGYTVYQLVRLVLAARVLELKPVQIVEHLIARPAALLALAVIIALMIPADCCQRVWRPEFWGSMILCAVCTLVLAFGIVFQRVEREWAFRQLFGAREIGGQSCD